jgi:hypothetical protein
MELTDEQKRAVAAWVAAGEGLSAIQRKLSEQFKVSLTYMDVRFLVDDLNLQVKDAAPKAAPELEKAGAPARPAGKRGLFDKAKEKLGLGREAVPTEDEEKGDLEEFDEELPPAGNSMVSVSVDKVTLIPGAIASGGVTFSDGVTGKWVVDNYGRPGFTELSRPDYRPSAGDAQAFMRELSAALQKRGF